MVEWRLILNGEACNKNGVGQVFQVGTECPYYNWPSKNFYTSAQSNQTGIYGPYDEFYYYQGGLWELHSVSTLMEFNQQISFEDMMKS